MNDCTYNSQFFEPNEYTKVTKADKQNVDAGSEQRYLVEQDDEDAEEVLWSIEDTLYYPIGLINHSAGPGRYVFVTWSEDYLLNFICKRNTKHDRIKVRRLPMPEEEEIVELLILELNTLLLMTSGNVYYFSTVKSMEPVAWLTGVRCISAAPGGFTVIRALAENTLSMERYKDVVNIGKCAAPTLIQKYDITFDERNFFNCQWQCERFTLVTQAITDHNLPYLEELIWKSAELKVHQEIHFFTVSTNVFALVPGDEYTSDSGHSSQDFHIQLLATYASNVEFIKVLPTRQLCLVFLACGAIDIWYKSSIANALKRLTHETGTQYTHYEFSNENACFYYTDDEKVAQLQFVYDNVIDAYVVQEHFKAVPGIQACTWVEELKKLICLSCNNIFYSFSFRTKPEDGRKQIIVPKSEYENLQRLYELTPPKIAKLLEKAQTMKELEEAPLKLQQKLDVELVKQQLIRVAHKSHIYETLLEAQLIYQLNMPTYCGDTQVVYTNPTLQLDPHSYFALINFKMQSNTIFQQATWHLLIDYDGSATMLQLPPILHTTKLCIAIPSLWRHNSMLPKFNVKLLTFVNHESDFVAIALTTEPKTVVHTFSQLFSLSAMHFPSCSAYSLEDLIDRFNKQAVTRQDEETLVHTMALPLGCGFESILACFTASNVKVQDSPSERLDLYFINSCLRIVYIKEHNFIKLESGDAVALYYTKLHIYNFLKSQQNGNCATVVNLDEAEDRASSQQLLLQYQSEIERFYGLLLHSNQDQEINEGSPSNALHSENLKRIYTKLRSDFHRLFRF